MNAASALEFRAAPAIEFNDIVADPKKSNESLLEAIQMAWIDERDGARESALEVAASAQQRDAGAG